jgi:hypothetical protein
MDNLAYYELKDQITDLVTRLDERTKMYDQLEKRYEMAVKEIAKLRAEVAHCEIFHPQQEL